MIISAAVADEPGYIINDGRKIILMAMIWLKAAQRTFCIKVRSLLWHCLRFAFVLCFKKSSEGEERGPGSGEDPNFGVLFLFRTAP